MWQRTCRQASPPITSPSLDACIQAAKTLTELPIDWKNLRKEDVRSLPDDVKTQINVIRAAASADADIYTQAEIDAAVEDGAGTTQPLLTRPTDDAGNGGFTQDSDDE